MSKYDLIIIGAGPAGLTAGLYAGRFRLKCLILERMSPGGQIILSSTIENFPGFPGGIPTHELIGKFRRQIDDLGVEIRLEEVTGITPGAINNQPAYQVKTGENLYETKTIILASGAAPKRLGVEGEDKFIGKGVSYCGTCDGPLFKNKDLVVVGGGDRAMEDAIFLSAYAGSVTVIHRRQQLRSSRILQEKAKAIPKINFVLDTVVERIVGEEKVDGLTVKNVKTGLSSAIACQGVFIFVGITPNTAFLKNLLQINDLGFIITHQNSTTSLPGIFACGDCISKTLYQVVNACGEAAVAADAAHKYLMNL